MNGDYRINSTMTLSAGYSKSAGYKGCGAGLSSTAAVPTCGGGMGATHKSLGFDMAMSKRTSLYAVASTAKSGSGGVVSVGTAAENARFLAGLRRVLGK